MSWQDYVDDELMKELPDNRSLKSGAIIGLDGSVWAQSENFPEIADEQIEALVKSFDDAEDMQAKGIMIGEAKYFAIQGVPGSVVRGKFKTTGFTAKKTDSCFVLGIYDEGVQPGECNVRVENLADYLIDQGY